MNPKNKPQRRIKAPAGYEPGIARWVWAIEDTRQRTRRCLDGVTDEVVDWIPPEGGNSIGMLLYHLVAIEMSYLYADILEIGWAEELEPLLIYDVRDDFETVAAGYDMEVVLPAIRCPVLLLQADPASGGLMTDAEVERALPLFGGAAQVVRLNGISHVLHNEQKEPVLRALDAFIH